MNKTGRWRVFHCLLLLLGGWASFSSLPKRTPTQQETQTIRINLGLGDDSYLHPVHSIKIYISLSLSLSLPIYIYIHIYKHVYEWSPHSFKTTALIENLKHELCWRCYQFYVGRLTSSINVQYRLNLLVRIDE